MWKKALLLLSLFAFTVVVTVPADSADARPRSFSSGKKSFNKTPAQSDSGVSKSSTSNKSSASSAGSSTNRGFFSGGSFMKGMMIGGLAGLMFGGMFGSGFFGNMMGFLLNAIALVVLFMVARGIYDAFKRRRQSQNPNHRRW
jgi:predicted lipid-binding transport protein (Tim44 family)